MRELDPADPERDALLDAQAQYHQAVTTAHRTHAVNTLYGSAMSPLEIAQTIPEETIELLLIWREQT
jgi:hypothetical protein